MHWGNDRSWFLRCVSYGPGRQSRNEQRWLTTAYRQSESLSKPDVSERALERRALLRAARQYKLDIERSNEELRRSKEERELLQAQIIQSEKMAVLGTFASGLAHEVRIPVTLMP